MWKNALFYDAKMRWNLLDKTTWASDVPDETMMMARP
jgi:hypothetical protein